MKNLVVLPDEQLENLDKKERVRPDFITRERRSSRGRVAYGKLDRFLKSRVGLVWDTVISEFVHKFELPADVSPLHTLRDHVETNTFLENGEVCANNSYCFMADSIIHITEKPSYRDVLYVHPETRKLCLQPKAKRETWVAQQAKSEAKWLRRLGPWHQLQKIDGIWYEVKLNGMDKLCFGDSYLTRRYKPDAPINVEFPVPLDWYKFLPGYVEPKPNLSRGAYRRPIPKEDKPVFMKRQLGHKELKQHGLVL